MGEAWIIDAVRTPRGKGRKDVGALVQTHPQELMAITLRALAARNALDPHDVDDVVVGCVSQAGDQGAAHCPAQGFAFHHSAHQGCYGPGISLAYALKVTNRLNFN